MVLNFVEKVFSINGGGDVTSPFTFYKNGFEFGSLKAPEPTWQDIIISGNTALTLVNAKADGLNYLKAFGGGENKSMLPAGYTQYSYLRNGAEATLNTGWRPTADDIVLDIRFYCNSTGSMYLWQSRDTSSGAILGLGGSQSGATISLYGGGGSSPLTSSISRTTGNIYHVIATLKNGNATLYVKDETNNIEDIQTGTYTFGANSTKFYFFGNSAQYVANGYRIYSAKCWYQGRLIQNWVAAQDANENSGIYNLVDGTFVTNSNTWVMGTEINNPSPSYPMDIVCNNGRLKVRNKNGLPSGYAQLNYIQASNGQYINTGFYFNDLTKNYVVHLRTTIDGATGVTGQIGYSGINGQVMLTLTSAYGLGTSGAGVPNQANHIYDIYQYRDDDASRYMVIDDTTLTQGSQTNTSENPYCIYKLSPISSTYNSFWGKLYELQIYENNVLKINYIPCIRLSDNEIGLYDTVNEEFITNAGTGSFVSGGINVEAYEIYIDGTTETVEIKGKNLWDTNGFNYAGVDYAITKTTYGFTATARSGAGTSARVVVYIPMGYLKANTTYFISGVTGVGNVYIGRTVNDVSDNGYYKNTGSSKKFTITDIAEGQTRFILTMYLGRATEGTVKDFSQIQLEEGTSATDYVIPFNGGTATAENLLKVNETADVQNITTGEITRGIYTLVLTGNEPFTSSKVGTTSRYVCALDERALSDGKSSRGSILSTHFISIHANTQQTLGGAFTYSRTNLYIIPSDQSLDTTEKFIAWLEEQYVNGTPVIVCYPLETSTTETVTAQTLTTQAGTNIVEITQASIDGLPLEVSYKAGVTVTVEEVENANLDDSVTVTIGE